MAQQRSGAFLDNLGRMYGMYTGVFIAFVILLGIAEKMGLPPQVIGYIFMGVTIGVYALIALTNPTYVPPSSSGPVPLRVDLVWSSFGRNMAAMLALSMLAAFIPARRSARMSIVDALGHL